MGLLSFSGQIKTSLSISRRAALKLFKPPLLHPHLLHSILAPAFRHHWRQVSRKKFH